MVKPQSGGLGHSDAKTARRAIQIDLDRQLVWTGNNLRMEPVNIVVRYTSQMIASGTVKPKEIVKTFGVPMITVKRYMKVYRDCGAKGFYQAKPQHSSASVLKGEVREQAQRLLDEGSSVPEVAQALQVLANTLHKAIRAGRLRASQKKMVSSQPK